MLKPKPRSRPRFSKPFAHFSAPKRAVTKRCGETVLGPRFGTVTRAYGDMVALVSGATFRRFDSSDVLETGDISGDEFSGLPCHVGEPRRASQVLGGLPR